MCQSNISTKQVFFFSFWSPTLAVWSPYFHILFWAKVALELPSLKLTANAPENRPKPNRKVVFQPSIFRGYVSFREGKNQNRKHLYTILHLSAIFPIFFKQFLFGETACSFGWLRRTTNKSEAALSAMFLKMMGVQVDT